MSRRSEPPVSARLLSIFRVQMLDFLSESGRKLLVSPFFVLSLLAIEAFSERERQILWVWDSMGMKMVPPRPLPHPCHANAPDVMGTANSWGRCTKAACERALHLQKPNPSVKPAGIMDF